MGKFILMSICSLGIYEVYWFYKNWHYIRERRQNNISPVIRALFSPLWYAALMKELNKEVSRAVVHESGTGLAPRIPYLNRWLWASSYFIFSILVNIPEPYWLVIFILATASLLPSVSVINRLNFSGNVNFKSNSKLGIKNLLVVAIGGLLLSFFIAITFNFMPNSQAIPGSRLMGKDLALLKDYGLLEEDEEVIYFYSGGIFSIAEDGNFFTDRKVVSYEQAVDSDDIYSGMAYYDEIADIEVRYSQSFIEDTVITIKPRHEEEFQLIVSSEAGLDKTFVKLLMKEWNEEKDKKGHYIDNSNEESYSRPS